ncbi:MAG: methyltransferase domain-containing protein [Lachnospiraceae bacterium]|nr:methyltransferase domain-containing protein [Lachnospiraceae bacterium]MBO6208989.1 methyltransferase domain-containing protein [Lachnospiraceae bacterium]
MGNYDFSLDLESVNTMSVINGWIKEGSRILEFGPANGRLTKYLKEEKDCRMTIVEIDGETGREASAFAEKAYLGEEGDIEKFKWTAETEPFDYIIFADVLEHLHCPDRVLKEASDLLKPEGEILVSVPNITHNSILIDLINDRFDYDETGLLDRTHVHFFSYDSFVKLCGANGVKIVDMVPVYSRVGDNEIKNTWRDVPAVLERELRKRAHGSVYQYVYRIRRAQSELPAYTKLPEGIAGEDRAPFEWKLYRRGEEDYSEEKCIRGFYHDGEEVNITLTLNDTEEVREVRLAPMAESGLIEVTCAEISTNDGTTALQPSLSSAAASCKRWFLFRETPLMTYALPRDTKEGSLHLTFRLLEYRLNGDTADNLSRILSEKSLETEDLRKVNADASEYIRRLEEKCKEADAQKEQLEKQKEQISEAKGYICHLEKDIRELKAAIEELQKKRRLF